MQLLEKMLLPRSAAAFHSCGSYCWFSTILALIYWLTASLTRIEQSAKAAQRVAEGDLTGSVLEQTTISSTDEAGQLLRY